MIGVYDRKGNYRGILISLKDIKDEWTRVNMASFVDVGCYLYQSPKGRIGAIPQNIATIQEVEQ